MPELRYEDLKLPNYINNQPFLGVLTVSDAMTAAVLGGLGLMLGGNTGCGKTQYASDVSTNFFGGSVERGGEAIIIRATPETEVYNEIFTQMNITEGKRELTRNIGALLYRIEELNRTPPVGQNQFLGMGDGEMDYKGSEITLGREGYHMCLATVNIGGEFQGTFNIDKAMYSRMHVAFDFDYPQYQPTIRDKFVLKERKADPNVKKAPPRNISDRILSAYKYIQEQTEDKGTKANLILNYLDFGLRNCLSKGRKSKSWPRKCGECTHNSDEKALCSMIRNPEERTLQATAVYAAALEYMTRLKSPSVKIDTVDLMFKAFEVTGVYQSLLNPFLLRNVYDEETPVMMHEVVELLKKDYRSSRGFLNTSLDALERQRRKLVTLVEGNNIGETSYGFYDDLSESAKQRNPKIEPYTDARQIGMAWFVDYLDYRLSLLKK